MGVAGADRWVARRRGVTVGKCVLRDRQAGKLLALIPLRDFLAALIWLASFAGHKIAWRGQSFHLRNGKLTRTEP